MENISSIWSYFYILSFVLILIILYLYFSRWHHHWRSFMALAFPFITIMLIISIPFINSTRRVTVETDYSVLTSHILPAHIFITIIGELFFFFSFVGSILYLVMEWQLRKKGSMRLIYQLPNLETIENFNAWAISRSLILLTVGIIIGVVMVFISYKSLSLGTAKEFHTYFSWIVIFTIFLIRRIKRIASHNISIINIAFFLLLMFLFIFTNIYITSGFHSLR
ncbi:MAG: cytochrome c biogenesis protein CcsA [Spirochaetota bacterium]|nr:cytochrome c biogenesis protein CcsA [Spirochaetota bacterium]